MNILAISGSLRVGSVNSAFCRAAARLAPADISVAVYSGLGELPLFNPDGEECPAQSVKDLRRLVGESDAMLIASPEYAHGVSGPLKNALDWLVSHDGFYGKPVAVVNTSPRAHHACDSLMEILRTMSASIIDNASIKLPLLGHCITEDAMVAEESVRNAVRGVLTAMRAHNHGGVSKARTFRIELP